ncbi:MAG: hypothetical protein Q4G63_10230 [Bacteroidia bacterium]|nr:hypothetical protein [Bacteroidia bacterium]
MSQFCPLCGKNKSEKVLFCADCKNKIEKEYEVDVPEKTENINTPTGEDIFDKPEVTDKKEASLSKTLREPSKLRKNKRNVFIGLLVVGVLLVIGFFYYGQVVRKGNLDRSQWDMAVKENTIGGYLTYMQAFPKGKYYNLAEESLMKLKSDEAEIWGNLQISENTAELRDFIIKYPESPYNSLVKKRLDSLTWMATLNDNTAESYSKYMVMSQSGEFPGDYFGDAQRRYDMLFQSYPVTQTDLDSAKLTVDGFFTALSALNANEMSKYLAPTVFQFFSSGGGQRDKIVGDLIISGARTQASTVKYLPNMNAVAYEKTLIEHYKVNVPVQKSFVDDGGRQKTVSGYIVHLELDRNFQIITITESKPSDDAV